MSNDSSPSATPTPRTAPLPDPSSPISPSLRRGVRSPLNPLVGGSPKSLKSLLISSSFKNVPRHPVQQRDGGQTDPSQNLQPLSMTIVGTDPVIALPEIQGDDERIDSTFRARSRSSSGAGKNRQDLPESNLVASWWGGDRHLPRPWQNEHRRQRTVPPEHVEVFEETRKTVAKALVSVLGTTAEIIHETLTVGADLLELAPIPGLAIAARTLADIWDSVQEVDMNQLACLRLTERCADILISVREEIHEAGDQVGDELTKPISKLEESYLSVYRFMVKQKNRPWLKRYLKRDEILRDIAACDNMLRDALSLFGVSIQIRILRQVQKAEKQREFATIEIIKTLTHRKSLPPNTPLRIIVDSESQVASPEISPSKFTTSTTTEASFTSSALGLIEGEPISPTNIPASGVIHALETLHTLQNDVDTFRDTSHLRQLMRAALATNSDKEMLEVLQIARQEMPDAIKALQRERERIVERNGENLSSSTHSDLATQGVQRRMSVKTVDCTSSERSGTLKRSNTVVSIDSSSSAGSSSLASYGRKDTLDQEFLEMGIDCLTRMTGAQARVPIWTITKFEVDREEKIGVGFFSDVYKGTWNGRTVAIKVLAETTPRKTFIREVGIWKTLSHPNVVPLYGASSTTGDPPWFLVSPYITNGNLVEYLKRVEQELRPPGLGVGVDANQPVRHSARSAGWRSASLPGPWGSLSPPPMTSPQSPGTSQGHSLTPPGTSHSHQIADQNFPPREWDLFRFMHEIAKGMEYLHGNDVLHGDLKAVNILVDHRYRCLISDFGQSEMKSEAFRMSGKPPHLGTLRWQAPEFMSGRTSDMTPAMDVWSYAISCVEILTMGRMPWPLMDDNAVRHFVLKDDTRPPLPKNSRFLTPRISELLRNCWQTDPAKRHTFVRIAKELKLLRKSIGTDQAESPHPQVLDLPEPNATPSPDMRPSGLLPQYTQGSGAMPPPDDMLDHSYPSITRNTAANEQDDVPVQESTIGRSGVAMPEPVIYTPASSRQSSMRVRKPTIGYAPIPIFDGHESPPPMDKIAAQRRNEGRYRLLLIHDHHSSLILPLWEPTPVDIGAVGYLMKGTGRFVTFFNAFNPGASSQLAIQSLPMIQGYGTVKDGVQYEQQPSWQQTISGILGSLIFSNKSESLVRRTTFPLKDGHPAAYLYTENTEYRYIETLDAPKKWFQVHADTILRVYGPQANINKEDLFLIIGTLRTQNYALMVSHQHPEGHAHFNVYSNPKSGRPWGTFTTDDTISSTGPAYDFDDADDRTHSSECKVSCYNGPMNAVLLARLRFKPDATSPTSR